MALSLVQSGDSGSVGSGSPGNVLSSATAVGNCVAVFVVTHSANTPDVSTFSSPGGTFVRIASVNNGLSGGFARCLEWWVCLKTTGTNANVATLTQTDGQGWQAQATEWAGKPTSSRSAGSAGATSASAAQLVTNGAGQVALVGAVNDNSGSFTGGPASPWTDYNGSATFDLAAGQDVAWQVTTAPGVTATWTLSSNPWTTLAIVLAAGGGFGFWL